jgi:hypothetical protein
VLGVSLPSAGTLQRDPRFFGGVAVTVIGRRVMARRAAERDAAEADEVRQLVEDLVAEVLPQMLVDCLSDPSVIRALRQTLGGKTTAGPTPLRAAEIKRRR